VFPVDKPCIMRCCSVVTLYSGLLLLQLTVPVWGHPVSEVERVENLIAPGPAIDEASSVVGHHRQKRFILFPALINIGAITGLTATNSWRDVFKSAQQVLRMGAGVGAVSPNAKPLGARG